MGNEVTLYYTTSLYYVAARDQFTYHLKRSFVAALHLLLLLLLLLPPTLSVSQKESHIFQAGPRTCGEHT